MTDESRWELTATTDEGTLDRILDLLGEMLASAEIDEDTRMQFEVSVAEIAANVIEHAGGGEPVGLRLDLRLTPDRLEATFTDDGNPAKVALRSVEMPGSFAERGRGLAIALASLDELEYRRRGGDNMWRLVCYRSVAGGRSEGEHDEPTDDDDDDEVSGPRT